MSMSYFDEDYGEDVNQVEDEKVESAIEGTKIKLEMDTEVLQRSIINAVHAELVSSLKAGILADIKAEILPALKEEIVNHTNEIVKFLIDDIYKNEKITIGGGWNEERKELTFKEFVRTEIKKKLDEGQFKSKGGYKINFADYIKNTCIDGAIESAVNKNIDEIRKDINTKLKTIFDTQTKNMLSDTVLNVLMASESYQNVENSIKRLADKSK